MSHPLVDQGTLNRIRSSVVVPNYTNLNANAENMGQNFVSVSLNGDLAQLIKTATGGVPSPEPYVEASITVDLLRTQSLSADWLNQAKSDSSIGEIVVHPDSKAFPKMEFHTGVIQHIDPGAFDGQDPVVKVSLSGIFYLNDSLWSFT